MEHMKVIVTIHQTERYTNYAGKDAENNDDVVLEIENMGKVADIISALQPDVSEIAVEITVSDYDHRKPKPEVSEDGEGE